MSYPQGPQQMPPSGNGNRGNGNPFKRNSPNDPNGNQKGNNSGGPQPFWKSPWLWGVLLVVMAVAGFQLFAGAGTQTIDTKDGFALLKTENVAYAKIIDNKQLVQLELKSNFTKTDPDTNKPHNYGKKVQFYYTFAQGAQVVQADAVRIDLDGHLRALEQAAGGLDGVEQLNEARRAVKARRAAAKIHRVDVRRGDAPGALFDVLEQGVLIVRHAVGRAGAGIKIAVAALARAKRDVDIDTETRFHRQLLTWGCPGRRSAAARGG